ncbi:MAG: hypothetical protein ABIR48_05710 [Gammaproteobacteria bacterium]
MQSPISFASVNFASVFISLLLISLAGCATWSTSSVDGNSTAKSSAAIKPTLSEKILVTESDITNRAYSSLGDITATVNKTTIFNADPTKELVNQKLRQEAAKLGADAVVLVRYGKGGVSFMSWGSLEGKGRAIKFNP